MAALASPGTGTGPSAAPAALLVEAGRGAGALLRARREWSGMRVDPSPGDARMLSPAPGVTKLWVGVSMCLYTPLSPASSGAV